MPATTRFALPYPLASASDNVPYDMQLLAEAVEATLRKVGQHAAQRTTVSAAATIAATAFGTAVPSLTTISVTPTVGMRFLVEFDARATIVATSGTCMIVPGIAVSGAVTSGSDIADASFGGTATAQTISPSLHVARYVDVAAGTTVTFTAEAYKAGTGSVFRIDTGALKVTPIALT